MKCKICGATCRCKRASGGICCGCHSHKPRKILPAVRAIPFDQLPLDWQAEVARLRAVEETGALGPTQRSLFE